jgi:hypothetical protein
MNCEYSSAYDTLNSCEYSSAYDTLLPSLYDTQHTKQQNRKPSSMDRAAPLAAQYFLRVVVGLVASL